MAGQPFHDGGVARNPRCSVDETGEELIVVDRAPIFVVGIERSGTSLLFALLASHPNIAMTRRTNLWTHFYGQYGDLSDEANVGRCIDMMMRYRRLRILDLDAERLRDDFLSGSR